MARIKWLTDYAGYKVGSEHEVSDLKKLKQHIEKGRIEVLKAKPETAAITAETATLKTEAKPVNHAKNKKK